MARSVRLRMPPGAGSDSIAALVDLVAELVREKEETKRLLAAFAKGEIGREQIVEELASRYQLGIGSAVQALAEHDGAAAQQLGERLRSRLDSALAEIASRGNPSKSRSQDASPAPASSLAMLKERDDAVLKREYVLLSAMSSRNEAVRSADLIKAAQKQEPGLSDEAVTAHLIRLLNAGIIGKERKGRYHGTPLSRGHLDDLAREIEARGLTVPAKTAI